MKCDVKQTPLFRRQFKRLHRNEQEIVARLVEELREKPTSGESLDGVLRAYKSLEVERLSGNWRLIFRHLNPENMIHLIAVGPHRTIYDEATRYVKETKL
jgi:mRNA-degrading endonuclease RelE of RelBE toxin-antitoxin system